MPDKIKVVQEINAGDLVESRCTPAGNAAHIPMPRKHRGKYVSVIIPDHEEAFLLFDIKLLETLRKHIDSVYFGTRYADQRKRELEAAFDAILTHPQRFDLSLLRLIYAYFNESRHERCQKITAQIREAYGF